MQELNQSQQIKKEKTARKIFIKNLWKKKFIELQNGHKTHQFKTMEEFIKDNYYRHFPIKSFKIYVAGKKNTVNKINSQIKNFQKIFAHVGQKS